MVRADTRLLLFAVFIALTTNLQPPDRRDRLIYVLSQINAARGDDTMQVDEESSSEESEEEVREYVRVVG